MSTLADLIVAADSDAQAVVASEYPLGDFSGVNVDGLDPLLIAALHSLLAGEDLDQLLGQYQPVAEGSPSGPWLVKLPAQLIDNLTTIAPQDQPQAAAQWAATPQTAAQGWSKQQAEAYLAQLIHFAGTASFEKQALFLCAYD